jgi:trans-aconitate methyltransferase
MGFDVEVVDSAPTGLDQLLSAATERGLTIHITFSDIGSYRPIATFKVIVAALLFHIPPRWLSLGVAQSLGSSLEVQGLFYVSLPGYTSETRDFALQLVTAAGCQAKWMTKHLVTKAERPRLQVPRRNETRVLGVKTG